MIVLIGGEKGGTGKSTIATNLAAYLANRSDDVVLLDADSQATAKRWVERRNNSGRIPSFPECTVFRRPEIFSKPSGICPPATNK